MFWITATWRKNTSLRAQESTVSKKTTACIKQEFGHRPGTSSKLLPKFSGPFKIQNLVGHNNARLQDIVTGKILKNLVSLDHLRRARDRRELIRKYWENQPQQSPPIADSTSVAAETPSAVGFGLMQANDYAYISHPRRIRIVQPLNCTPIEHANANGIH
jgi:hypothetical protein